MAHDAVQVISYTGTHDEPGDQLTLWQWLKIGGNHLGGRWWGVHEGSPLWLSGSTFPGAGGITSPIHPSQLMILYSVLNSCSLISLSWCAPSQSWSLVPQCNAITTVIWSANLIYPLFLKCFYSLKSCPLLHESQGTMSWLYLSW